MIQLARVKLTDVAGREVSLRAMDVRTVTEYSGGSILQMDGGTVMAVSESVTTVHNAIDALFDEINTAVGDPA